MRNRILISSLASLAAFAAYVISPAAHAGACLKAASGEYKDCRSGCQEDSEGANDACLNRDHTCVEACRAERGDCREGTGIEAALDQCESVLTGAVQNCRNQFPAGSDQRDTCIDQAQVVAFQCRDAARHAALPALKQCRKDFRLCAMACGPANPPCDTRQCRADAREALKSCNASCKEDLQVSKDACHNKDHTCVEGCRADRDTCNDPTQAQLAADLAACKAQRQAAVAACKVAFPNPGSDLDQCIENAEAQAFVCRDNAHEAARPGLEMCRQDFHACVQQCPPPAPPN